MYLACQYCFKNIVFIISECTVHFPVYTRKLSYKNNLFCRLFVMSKKGMLYIYSSSRQFSPVPSCWSYKECFSLDFFLIKVQERTVSQNRVYSNIHISLKGTVTKIDHVTHQKIQILHYHVKLVISKPQKGTIDHVYMSSVQNKLKRDSYSVLWS